MAADGAPEPTPSSNTPVAADAPVASDEPLIPEHVARFLAALPTTARRHPMEWILQFRDALLSLLSDVDRVSLTIDLTGATRSVRPPVEVIQTLLREREDTAIKTSVRIREDGHQYEMVIQRLKARENGLNGYQAPFGFDLFLEGEQYLASIVLLREQTKPAIAAATITLIEVLRPFLTYAISGVTSAFLRSDPTHCLFHQLNRHIARDVDLTAGEVATLMLQYFGYTYEQIAATLHISPSSVQKRIKNIHRKTGGTTYLELFGRYVAPELLAAEEAGEGRERVVTVV